MSKKPKRLSRVPTKMASSRYLTGVTVTTRPAPPPVAASPLTPGLLATAGAVKDDAAWQAAYARYVRFSRELGEASSAADIDRAHPSVLSAMREMDKIESVRLGRDSGLSPIESIEKVVEVMHGAPWNEALGRESTIAFYAFRP